MYNNTKKRKTEKKVRKRDYDILQLGWGRGRGEDRFRSQCSSQLDEFYMCL